MSNYEAVKKHREKQKAVGNCGLLVWIPVKDKEKVLKYCERLRKAAGTNIHDFE